MKSKKVFLRNVKKIILEKLNESNHIFREDPFLDIGSGWWSEGQALKNLRAYQRSIQETGVQQNRLKTELDRNSQPNQSVKNNLKKLKKFFRKKILNETMK